MKLIARILLFLLINFSILYAGTLLMAENSTSDWYKNLEKAPWSPQGWVFGFAWTFLMSFFAIYLAKLSLITKSSKLIALVLLQYFLNVIWNYIFFNQHDVILGLIDITLLTFVVTYIFFKNISIMKTYSLLILPYFIWLLIATSLNLYIAIYN
ncbi:tryptophan-rich sensory protein [Flavobacteriaceae bacterium]|jgi:translocator protein|nr:tryptophan-rich sensory protein [Flavobacteriaceae bacterium]MDB9712861.1 tryptophan-rich sensory protein [Flavobacteriaceae bacterium]MDC1492283.1 tryptophan-rich sensory protein [Flavobacteriaceae bacterium]